MSLFGGGVEFLAFGLEVGRLDQEGLVSGQMC